MRDKEIQLTVILGPGNHQKKLIDAIKLNGSSFEVFNYYPVFTHVVFDSNGKETYNKTNIFLTSLVKLLWAITSRIKFLKHKNYPSVIQYMIFDFWVSRSFSKNSQLLWAWAQISLFTMKQFKKHSKKIVLEHPLIYVDEWNDIINKEYSQYAPNSYKYYMFNKRFTNRIKRECELADAVVLLSKFSENTFEKHIGALKKTLLVNLYAGDMFHQETDFKKTSTDFNILFAGRIDLIKGIHRLLPVFKKVKEKFNHIKLTLVGDVKEEIEHILVKYEDIVLVKKTISQSELVKEYQKADLFILPSVQESFGLVMLEALACGTTVMGSAYTGAPDIADVFKNVVVFDPYNEEDFENKLSTLIMHPTLNNNFNSNELFSKNYYERQIIDIIKMVTE